MKKKFIHFLYNFYRPVLIFIVGVDTTILGSLVILLSFIDRHGNIVHHIGKFWSHVNLFLAGVSVETTGRENIRKGQPYILMSNHQSSLDIWTLIGYIPLQLRWVMKIELRKVPVFGLGCERMGHIYIDRGHSEKAHENLKAVGKKIREGASVIFFPEGTRSTTGKLLPFKKGGFVVALEAGVPILPVTITGSFKLLPKKSLRVIPGKIRLIIHEPIPVDGYTYESKELLMDRVRKVIEKDLVDF